MVFTVEYVEAEDVIVGDYVFHYDKNANHLVLWHVVKLLDRTPRREKLTSWMRVECTVAVEGQTLPLGLGPNAPRPGERVMVLYRG